MASIFGLDDLTPLHLFRHLYFITNLFGQITGDYRKEGRISAARMRLLMRLEIGQELGEEEGLSPSDLSQYLGVSRNTVSALLNGLEEQGLVERHLHPTDRRQFLIRITPVGKARLHEHAPQFAAFVNSLFGDLSADEQQALLALLDKLFTYLVQRAQAMGLEVFAASSAHLETTSMQSEDSSIDKAD
ncbi:MAG: MarR family transcriptional regulator [Chloroflexi bacterium]|nr:MarR family transcriptional regulator [Chloroflexota bacterium]